MAGITLKKLEQYLQDVETFNEPKIKLEQYATLPHLSARVLYTIQTSFGDIEGKVIGDLGCGCGTLSIGSSLLGAEVCIGFDCDPDALKICNDNIDNFQITNIDTVLCDVTTQFLPSRFEKFFDCVIMNPPFGTKTKGLDIEFLKMAFKLTKNVVYSLHKTSTRKFVLEKAKVWGFKAEVLAQLHFDLPATYRFHKKSCVYIEVDFIRFSLMKADLC